MNVESLISYADRGRINNMLVFRDVVLRARMGTFKTGHKFPLAFIEPFSGKLILCEKKWSYLHYGEVPHPNHEFDLQARLMVT